MLKTYKYRIYPTKPQEQALSETLDKCRFLYNCALEQRITAYKKRGVSLSCYQQQAELPKLKEELPEFKGVYSQVLQEVLKRLDKAYRAFFRRVKTGAKASFPRFQGKHRYDSFTYPQYQQVPTERSVYLPKIGNVRIKLHRPIEGKIKTCTVKRDSTGKWFACFSVEATAKPLPCIGHAIGIDVGSTHIITTSDGEQIEAPKHLRKAERELRKAQRRLARRERGSNRRTKARLMVAKLHQKVANQRKDFLHKLAHQLITENDLIAIEDLNLLGLTRGMLSKSFHDVSIGQLFQYLAYKAEYAGRRVVRVSPDYTSQDCCVCGYRSGKKPLHIRSWTCEVCHTSHDRDVNAAKNILARAWPSGINVAH